MKTDRVVLDINVYVSLILSKRLNELVEWKKDFGTTIFLCPELTGELKNVLNRPKIKRNLTEPVSSYINFILLVSESIIIDKRFDRSPDIKDNYLFDLAYSVKSHYLVTNDRPLLNMKQVNRIKIIALSEWRKQFK